MDTPLAYGMFGYDLAHLLGGAVLVGSFALLYQRRLAAVINIYALQAWAVTAAAFWQGWVQASPELYATGLIAFAAKGVAIPFALHAIVRRLQLRRSVESALGVFPSMIAGVGLVVLAVLVVLPTIAPSQVLTREDLALALSVVLLGLLVMITRRTALTQVVGFLSMENGLSLAAVGGRGLPLVVEFSVGVLVLVGMAVFGVFFFRIRERFDSLDLSHLDRIGRVRR
jgi:hydrogenase-4 component E